MKYPGSLKEELRVLVKVPLHVSGIWFPVMKCNLISSGSLGAGVNLDLRLSAKLNSSQKSPLLINGQEYFIEHYSYILRRIGAKPIKILIESPVRPGAGFAVSAASSIAVSLILQLVSGIKKTVEKMLWPAHEAEIMMSTGLGDVLAEYFGGAEIRVRPGAPGIGMVEHIPFDDSLRVVVTAIGASLGTPRMLAEIGDAEYGFARELYSRLVREPGIEELFTYSNMFTRKIFDYSLVDKLLLPIKNLVLGYYLKKSALVILVDKQEAREVNEYLSSKGLKSIITRIGMEGIKIVYTRESPEKRKPINKRENSRGL